MNKSYPAVILAAAAIILTACGPGNQPAGNPSKPTAAEGDAVYNRTCVACHQSAGQGVPGAFPPLAKSDYLADRENTIKQVLTGSSGELVVNGSKYNNTMPPQQLSDEETAAVLTYVYSNFGNSGGPVTAGEVKAVRAKL